MSKLRVSDKEMENDMEMHVWKKNRHYIVIIQNNLFLLLDFYDN